MSERTPILTRPPELAFERQISVSPALAYIGREDGIWVASRSSAAVTVAVRGLYLRPDGEVVPFELNHATSSDRGLTSSVAAVGEGFLISVYALESTSSVRIGTLFVRVGLSRGITAQRFDHSVLCQGYVARDTAVAWPNSPMSNSVDGRGLVRYITGTDPAAGAEISEEVPTFALWRVMGVSAQLVTDATVANRRPRLVLDDAGTRLLTESPATAAQAASLTRDYFWQQNMPHETNLTTTAIIAGVPTFAFLRPGDRIRTITENLQTGDNWGAPTLWIEEWIYP